MNIDLIPDLSNLKYTPPAGLRQFREGKHSAGQRRKADPRKKQLRKKRQAAKRRNRGK